MWTLFRDKFNIWSITILGDPGLIVEAEWNKQTGEIGASESLQDERIVRLINFCTDFAALFNSFRLDYQPWVSEDWVLPDYRYI